MSNRIVVAALASCLVGTIGLPGRTAWAQESDKLDKKVLDIVKKSGELYKNAKRMHAESSIVTKIEDAGEKKEIKASADYDVEKPKMLAIKSKIGGDDKKGADIFADGKNLTIFRKGMKKYTAAENPESLGDLSMTILQLGAPNVGMLFANILGDDPGGQLMDGVSACSYVGLEKLDGTPVHHLKFTQAEFDWELMVAAEGKPFILQMVSTRDGNDGKAVTTETYKNWKLDAEAPKTSFEFTAPKDATKVDSFQQRGVKVES